MSFELPAARQLLQTLSSLERSGDGEKEMLVYRKEVLAALKAVGFDLSKTPAKPKKKLVWAQRYTLVVMIDDHEFDLALHAVPVAELPEALGEALKELDGLTFAGPADLSMEQWAAAVRVAAAMADEVDPKKFYERHVGEYRAQFKKAKVVPPTLDEVKALWNTIGKHRLTWLDNDPSPLKLDLWFSSGFAYQRAM